MIGSWFADDPGPPFTPRVLTNISLDLAVAQGAAYYGVVRRGGGIRIGGGTARSFYVGLETAAASKPWLCVVPRDAQEGEEITIAGHDFDLLMGQPVVFPLASSSVRPDDKPGALVKADPDSIRELPPLQSLMRVSRKAKAERVPVSLAARVTEVGTIELWCQSRTDNRRWRLQIQLRGPAGQLAAAGPVTGNESDRVVIEQSEVDAAIAAIRLAFESPTASSTGRFQRRQRGHPGWSSGSKRFWTCRATSGPRRPCGLAGSHCSNWPKSVRKALVMNRDGSISPDSSSVRDEVSRSMS